MMAGRLPARVRGEGWEVWLDDAGVLWTRLAGPAGGGASGARLAALGRFLARRAVAGVLVQDEPPASGGSQAFDAFVKAHGGMPLAIVAGGGTLPPDVAASSIATFASVTDALVWLSGRGPPRRWPADRAPQAWLGRSEP